MDILGMGWLCLPHLLLQKIHSKFKKVYLLKFMQPSEWGFWDFISGFLWGGAVVGLCSSVQAL